MSVAELSGLHVGCVRRLSSEGGCSTFRPLGPRTVGLRAASCEAVGVLP